MTLGLSDLLRVGDTKNTSDKKKKVSDYFGRGKS